MKQQQLIEKRMSEITEDNIEDDSPGAPSASSTPRIYFRPKMWKDDMLSELTNLESNLRNWKVEIEAGVPIYAAVSWPKLDWMGFFTMLEGLSEDMRRVGTIVGVEERWMVIGEGNERNYQDDRPGTEEISCHPSKILYCSRPA